MTRLPRIRFDGGIGCMSETLESISKESKTLGYEAFPIEGSGTKYNPNVQRVSNELSEPAFGFEPLHPAHNEYYRTWSTRSNLVSLTLPAQAID